jgi:LysM repeat protein
MSTPAEPSTPARGGGSLVSKLGGPRTVAILGAGGAVVVVALLARRNSGSSGAAASSTDGFDSGPYDMWNQWQQEYDYLQQQITGLDDGTTTATGPGSTPPPPSTQPTPKPPVPVPVPKPPPPPSAPSKPPPQPTPKPPASSKPPAHKTVTVKKGDTLSGIAKKSGISLATLKKLNPVYWTNKKYKNGNLIFAGDKVKVS